MRIFIVGYSGNKGGVETYIDQLSSSLPQYEFVYSLSEMNIGRKVWHRPSNRHNYVKYRLFWRKFFRENKFDVLYYNTCDVVSIDMLKFAKKAGIPVRIIHSHSSGIQQAIKNRVNLFHQMSERHNRNVLNRYATLLFACSQTAGDWMFGNKPYTIIKNGIQLSRYAYSEEKRKILRDSLGLKSELLVGIVGRLSKEKNPLYAIQVILSLVKKHPATSAVFLGDGELRESIESAMEDTGIRDHVQLLGNVDNVNEWLSAMDVLLMPSLFEGLPFVLVEAQANGLPCVVSSEVTQEANMTGLLQYVQLNSPPDVWADSIIQMKGNRKYDTYKKLTESGYNFETTSRCVAQIIDNAFY